MMPGKRTINQNIRLSNVKDKKEYMQKEEEVNHVFVPHLLVSFAEGSTYRIFLKQF